MLTQLARVTILVKDQDEALKFYTEKLGLEKRDDISYAPGMRWLTVAPKGQKEVEIVLHYPGKWLDPTTRRKVMRQIGKGVTWVFFCDNCQKTYEELRSRGVNFTRPPTKQMYGVEALFEDLYGNMFSILERP